MENVAMEVAGEQASPRQDPADWLKLLFAFLLPFAVSLLIALLFEPLGRHQAEEYLELARQSSNLPSSLFRPPGYVAFLRFINFASGGINNDWLVPIYIGQGIVLGLATIVFYLTACRWMARLPAWLIALAFGCNPLAAVLVGYVHYDLLHLCMLVLSGLLLVRAFADRTPPVRWALFAGVACGLTALVRPMTLVEPAFLALALGVQSRIRKQRATWLAWAAFSLALMVTIIPRSWKNYSRTGRFIPVNAQTMAALWPMFEEPLKPDSSNFPWRPLWFNRGVPLLAARVGPAARDPAFPTIHPLIFEDVFYSRTRELAHSKPGVYFENLADNAFFFLAGDSRTMIRTFIFYQNYETMYTLLPPRCGVVFFIIFSGTLNFLGISGLALGLWRREPTLLMLASLFLCLWVVHSMLYLDYRYIYVKLPFMILFSAYLFGECCKRLQPGGKPMTWIPAAFTISSLLGTALLVF